MNSLRNSLHNTGFSNLSVVFSHTGLKDAQGVGVCSNKLAPIQEVAALLWVGILSQDYDTCTNTAIFKYGVVPDLHYLQCFDGFQYVNIEGKAWEISSPVVMSCNIR